MQYTAIKEAIQNMEATKGKDSAILLELIITNHFHMHAIKEAIDSEQLMKEILLLVHAREKHILSRFVDIASVNKSTMQDIISKSRTIFSLFDDQENTDETSIH